MCVCVREREAHCILKYHSAPASEKVCRLWLDTKQSPHLCLLDIMRAVTLNLNCSLIIFIALSGLKFFMGTCQLIISEQDIFLCSCHVCVPLSTVMKSVDHHEQGDACYLLFSTFPNGFFPINNLPSTQQAVHANSLWFTQWLRSSGVTQNTKKR